MDADEVAKIVGGLGLGASAGAIIVALINAQSQKGKSRAEAAEVLMSAAERVAVLNKEMDQELRIVKKSLDSAFWLIHQFIEEEITKEELLKHIRELRS